MCWCHDDDELLLVYELMPNDSLDTDLYNNPDNVLTLYTNPDNVLTYGIALDVGAALPIRGRPAARGAPRHQAEQRHAGHVVHGQTRRLRPHEAHLDDGHRSHTTGIAGSGTMGYMDPECMLAGRASVEADVYSFGVLLVEVTCGRRPAVHVAIGDEDEEEECFVHLVQWVWDAYGGGTILDAADARLAGEFDAREMAFTMLVGLCLRSTIRQAVNVLWFEAPPPILPAKMPVATYGAAAAGRYCCHGSDDGNVGHYPSTSELVLVPAPHCHFLSGRSSLMATERAGGGRLIDRDALTPGTCMPGATSFCLPVVVGVRATGRYGEALLRPSTKG
ncbi:hypothetical protein HU200_016986 [Digitaria exilis]|uniref:Protein kinase domain-containing protein n=1 Tax=Digitaria exilis TaxID=1010633 RepID=A0A835F6V3_9POAL|nr:hypothetical protein HU200_016986 [Digitaria exilis]